MEAHPAPSLMEQQMQRLTIKAAAARLDRVAELAAAHDEQFHLYTDAAHITPDLNGVPQPDTGEPIAIIISARRYAWLNAQAAKIQPADR